MKNQTTKAFFGTIIFAFSLSLAYFVANYVRDMNTFDYWGTIAIFAFAYVIVGILISSIFPISLGFLFSADVLVLHLLTEYYGKWSAELKLFIVGVILIILYTVAYVSFKEEPQASVSQI